MGRIFVQFLGIETSGTRLFAREARATGLAEFAPSAGKGLAPYPRSKDRIVVAPVKSVKELRRAACFVKEP